MKITRILPILLLMINFISCDKEDNNLPIVGKKFTHQIQDCEQTDNMEINCSEFFLFESNEEALGLIGGSDTGMSFNYYFKDRNTIFVYRPNSSIEYTFSIIHPDTLLDVSRNQKWVNE